ncbi:MAG: iron donor protein CyaY [Bdellovibrionota bacterium]
MDSKDFRLAADRTIESLVRKLDALGIDDADVDSSDGKLEITFDDGTKFIVSRQSAANQLWLAEPAGGWHYNFTDGKWTCDKRGVGLLESLEALLAGKTGRPIRLS